MIIRKYRDIPAYWGPVRGEVIDARLSIANPWVRAVVTRVSRNRARMIRIDFVWLAGCDGPGSPVVEGTKGHVTVGQDGRPPLIRRVGRGGAPEPD